MNITYSLKNKIPKSLFEKNETLFMKNTIRSLVLYSIGFYIGIKYILHLCVVYKFIYSVIQETQLNLFIQ